MRPNGDPADARTVCPGLHLFSADDGLSPMDHGPAAHSVVWWDPTLLTLGAEPPLGIRRSELIVKDIAPMIVDDDLAQYETWRATRDTAVTSGSRASISAQKVTQWAHAAQTSGPGFDLPRIDIVDLPREEGRPSGPRFGTLVHAVLATVPLNGD